MSDESKAAILTTEGIPEEKPSVKRPLITAAVWFVAVVVARVASVPLAAWIGLSKSDQYLLVQPVAFASGLAMLFGAYLVIVKFGFPNTLGRDMGTRFNKAFAALDDPFKILMVYAAFSAPIIIALGLMLANR